MRFYKIYYVKGNKLMNEEFQNLLKNALAMLKEKTVVDLIEHDYDYKKSVHEHGIAEKNMQN